MSEVPVGFEMLPLAAVVPQPSTSLIVTRDGEVVHELLLYHRVPVEQPQHRSHRNRTSIRANSSRSWP